MAKKEIISTWNWINIIAAFKSTNEIRHKELVDLIENFAKEQANSYLTYRVNEGTSYYKTWRKKQNQLANSKKI